MATDVIYRAGRPRPGRLVAALMLIGVVLLICRPDRPSTPEKAVDGVAGLPNQQVATVTTEPRRPSMEVEPATGLQPGLVDALARARADADEGDLEIPVASGFRTESEQLEEFAAAVERYGSEEEAHRWVFTPEKSAHTKGLAVDIGSGPAADWLESQGDRYGICKTLAWEWWHFEWRRSWEERGRCPAPAETPAEAPTVDG